MLWTGEHGGIVLMSHLGNWEIAAHLMKQKREQMPAHFIHGACAPRPNRAHSERRPAEQGHPHRCRRKRMGDTVRSPGGPAVHSGSGGLVSMTGDQNLGLAASGSFAVSFLGHEVYLPETPHLLAMLSGAPLFLFFSRRTGKRRYHNNLSEPIYIEKAPRRDRAEAIRRSAQRLCGSCWKKIFVSNPLEWYHFEQFLGPRLK